jgi:hypothetical protein
VSFSSNGKLLTMMIRYGDVKYNVDKTLVIDRKKK